MINKKLKTLKLFKKANIIFLAYQNKLPPIIILGDDEGYNDEQNTRCKVIFNTSKVFMEMMYFI